MPGDRKGRLLVLASQAVRFGAVSLAGLAIDVAIFLGGAVSIVAGLAGIVWYRRVRAAGGVPERLRTNRPAGPTGPATTRQGAGAPPAPSPRAMPGDVASR